MTLKERIENNIVLSVLGLLAVGFGTGFGAQKMISEGSTPSSTNAPVCAAQVPWADTARKSDWVPKNECPAYPVSINVTSPGDGSTIKISSPPSDPYASTDLVIQSSRPLPSSTSVGLIFNQEKLPNFYVVFPYLKIDESRKVFRIEQYVKLPFRPELNSALGIWAIIVDDKGKFGSVYSSLDQVKASGSDVTISPKISLNVQQR
jgi:hypothetical protein